MKNLAFCIAGFTFIAVGAADVLAPREASALVVVNAIETGGNVVFSGGGTLNLQELRVINLSEWDWTNGYLTPSLGIYQGAGGGTKTTASVYGGPSFAGPASFGIGGNFIANPISGEFGGIRGVNSVFPGVLVANTYSSGNPLSGTSTFVGQTFASMGLTPGTYTWTWGVGSTDSYTLNIGTNPTPVPGPLPIIGVAAAFYYSRKLKKRIRVGKLSVSSSVD